MEDGGSITDDGDTTRPTEEVDESNEDDDDEEDEDEDSVIENGTTDQTKYVQDAAEVFGTTENQTEEFGEENKSVIWFLMKQVS